MHYSQRRWSPDTVIKHAMDEVNAGNAYLLISTFIVTRHTVKRIAHLCEENLTLQLCNFYGDLKHAICPCFGKKMHQILAGCLMKTETQTDTTCENQKRNVS